ncbi:hypothetical protein CCR75_001232 [Bremia lactucae]|uniref:UBX domain-containing protein n=1 Tax=Bremia lactucae TaxID=4779 RepID=A0A976FPB9_BRELC|nr:hypothetical protein CCR75_001232 [Bremia lactucae]
MSLKVEFDHQSKRVSVTPDKTMFQVLAEAQDHFSLSDSRQYQLLHRSKRIDLSIPFRLTGISNNACLEIKELEGVDVLQQVRVCVQLRDGKRVQASFENDATLEHILTYFKLLPAYQQFCLGFLRREIELHAFATTTLRELGISSGSAMFRVQAIDGLAISRPPINNKLSKLSGQLSIAPIHDHVTVANSVASSALAPEALCQTLTPESASEIQVNETAPAISSYHALQLLRDRNFDAVSRNTVTTLMKIVTNILSELVGQVEGGLEFLKSIGFMVNEQAQMLVLTSKPSDKKVLEEGFRLLNIEADDLNISLNKRPAIRQSETNIEFDVYKTRITRVQMQPRGPSPTEALVGALRSNHDQLVGHDPPPRSTVITLRGRPTSDMLESLTEGKISEGNDVLLQVQSLKAWRNEMEKKKNFRTQAMRELDKLKRKKVFRTALIRVQFPDQAVLQATFHANETIQDVMDHVTDCMSNQFKTSKFYLYLSPPAQKLNATKTLTELNMVPAALTYLSWTKMPHAEMANVGFYFRDDLMISEHSDTKDFLDPLQHVTYPQSLQLGKRN